MGRGAVAAQAHVVGGGRTLYLGSEERLVHILVRQAKEILNSARSFWVEFPQAEGPAFARLDLTNQQDLHYHNQAKLSHEEIPDAALQYGHILGWTPTQPPADP